MIIMITMMIMMMMMAITRGPDDFFNLAEIPEVGKDIFELSNFESVFSDLEENIPFPIELR